MMPASEKEFVKDLVIRTKANYDRLKTGPYEVTQLLNSAVGLLIIPQQRLFDQIADQMVSAELLNKMLASVQVNSYIKPLNLAEITRHLRNSIAHAHVKYIAEKQSAYGRPILVQAIEFKDENPRTSETITIKLSVSLLEEFFEEFSSAASNLP
jgi:hypothetical protein